MKVVVTGSRAVDDPVPVREWLQAMYRAQQITEVVVGDCPTGADKYVLDWCNSNCVPCKVFKANWEKYHTTAGPIRNRKMYEYAMSNPGMCSELCHGGWVLLAFYKRGKPNKGTSHCRNLFKTQIPIVEVWV